MAANKRNIRVTAVPLEEPDLQKLARAIIDLAIELNASGADQPEPEAPVQSAESEQEAA